MARWVAPPKKPNHQERRLRDVCAPTLEEADRIVSKFVTEGDLSVTGLLRHLSELTSLKYLAGRPHPPWWYPVRAGTFPQDRPGRPGDIWYDPGSAQYVLKSTEDARPIRIPYRYIKAPKNARWFAAYILRFRRKSALERVANEDLELVAP